MPRYTLAIDHVGTIAISTNDRPSLVRLARSFHELGIDIFLGETDPDSSLDLIAAPGHFMGRSGEYFRTSLREEA